MNNNSTDVESGDSDTQYQTQALIDSGLVITNTELTNGTPLHNTFSGPVGFNGLVLFNSQNDNSRTMMVAFRS